MQITFDPLDKREAEYVRDMLGGKIMHTVTMDISAQVGETLRSVLAEADARSDLAPSGTYVAPKRTATIVGTGGTGGQSATPLSPDAPLPAAADLFSTAPAAQPAGEASVTPVPPPPVPVAPASDVPPTPVAPTNRAENGDLDKDGLPWDARIHSGSKAKNADGTWRSRRGLNDPALVKRVEDELRALMAIPSPSAVPLPPSANTATAPDTSNPTVAAAPIAMAPAAPPAAIATAPDGSTAITTSAPAAAPPVPAPVTSPPATAPIPTPPAPPAPIAAGDVAPITFAGLMRKVSGHLATKTLTPEQVDAAMASVQLTRAQMNLLAARSDLVEAVDAYIDSLLMGGA